jgi:hypothetical protein
MENPGQFRVEINTPGVLIASVFYFAATSASLPRMVDLGAMIDVFLTAAVPSLVVIMLLWAARPSAYPQRRRCSLVAAAILFSAVAAVLPLWVTAL